MVLSLRIRCANLYRQQSGHARVEDHSRQHVALVYRGRCACNRDGAAPRLRCTIPRERRHIYEGESHALSCRKWCNPCSGIIDLKRKSDTTCSFH